MSDDATQRALKANAALRRQRALQARHDPHRIKAQRDDAFKLLRKCLRWYASEQRDTERFEAEVIEPARALLIESDEVAERA